jgi:Astacin (Peptidase family M12A)
MSWRQEHSVRIFKLVHNFKTNTVLYLITAQAQVDYINLGLRLIELQTCLRFLPRQPENENYIYVTGENTGCWSFVGLQNGRQELNLQLYAPGSGCFRIGTIMHE